MAEAFSMVRRRDNPGAEGGELPIPFASLNLSYFDRRRDKNVPPWTDDLRHPFHSGKGPAIIIATPPADPSQGWPVTQPGRLQMAEVRPEEDILLTHFIVSGDVERSRRFYTEILGGKVAFQGTDTGPVNVKLSNSWIVINAGGGPTDDKPAVTLETPRDPDRVSSFLNIRVKDIEAVYVEWSAKGAQFLTPPKQHQYEIRCYIRDPDGHLIEVGQTTDPEGDWMPDQWPSGTSGGESE